MQWTHVKKPNLNTMDGIRSRIDRKRSCWATVWVSGALLAEWCPHYYYGWLRASGLPSVVTPIKKNSFNSGNILRDNPEPSLTRGRCDGQPEGVALSGAKRGAHCKVLKRWPDLIGNYKLCKNGRGVANLSEHYWQQALPNPQWALWGTWDTFTIRITVGFVFAKTLLP